MKKLAVLFFCCFFLISGRILLSIGLDVVTKRVDPADLMSIAPSLLQVEKTQSDEETKGDRAESDGWEKSPFRHLTASGGAGNDRSDDMESETAQPLNLIAISFGGGRVFAVINGRVLSVGEQIDGYTIMIIKRTEVELVKEGQTTKLILWDKPWEEDQ